MPLIYFAPSTVVVCDYVISYAYYRGLRRPIGAPYDFYEDYDSVILLKANASGTEDGLRTVNHVSDTSYCRRLTTTGPASVASVNSSILASPGCAVKTAKAVPDRPGGTSVVPRPSPSAVNEVYIGTST